MLSIGKHEVGMIPRSAARKASRSVGEESLATDSGQRAEASLSRPGRSPMLEPRWGQVAIGIGQSQVATKNGVHV